MTNVFDEEDDDFVVPKSRAAKGKPAQPSKKPAGKSMDEDDNEPILPKSVIKAKLAQKRTGKAAPKKVKARLPELEEEEEEQDFDFTPVQLLTPRPGLVPGTGTQAEMLKALAARGKAKLGSSVVFTGEEAFKLLVAIPVPSISIEYLFGVAGFPLGLFLQLVAETGVGKSGLLAEIARWFFLYGGGFHLIEAETKYNPFWYESILQQLYPLVSLYRSRSQEHWQENLVTALAVTKEQAEPKKKTEDGKKAPPGFGRSVPFLFGVDSLTAKTSESHQEKVLGEEDKDGRRKGGGVGHGVAGYTGMQDAGRMTDFFKTIPQEFDFWPFSLVTIGQLKMGADANGNPVRKIAGGNQVKFQQAFELELRKARGTKHKIVTQNFAGHELAIETFKNSWHEGLKRIHTRVLWRFQDYDEINKDTDGEICPAARQKTIWDWNWSLVWLINDLLENPKTSPMLKTRLRDYGIHVNCLSKGDAINKAYSTTLGQTKEDAVSWSKLGHMLQQDSGIRAKIRAALGIQEIALLGDDYAKQVKDLLASATGAKKKKSADDE